MYLGDSQMYPVDSKLREDVWAWALRTNIRIEYNGTDFGLDIWRVVDAKDCAMFILRWC